MVFNVSVAMNWILFLALFPIAFFWLRRAWRILVRGDYSEVAVKRGEPPANAAKFAPYAAIINLVAGVVIVYVIFGVVVLGLSFESWTSIAGITLWSKFLADFILRRHAHPMQLGKNKS